MEAGILNVGQDFDWTCNPFEVGLEWMVDLDKPFFHGGARSLASRRRDRRGASRDSKSITIARWPTAVR